AALGRRTRRHRPRSRRTDRRQPRARRRGAGGGPGADPAAGPSRRLRVRLERLHGTGIQEPVRLFPPRARVRPGRTAARRRAARRAGRRRLGRSEQRPYDAEDRRPGCRTGRRRRPALAPRRLPVRRRSGRPRRRGAPRAHPLPRAPRPRRHGRRRVRTAAGRAYPWRAGMRPAGWSARDELRPGPPDGQGAAPLARLGRVVARVRRPRDQPDRPGPLRVPAGGVRADADPTMTGAVVAGRRRRWPRNAAYGLAGLAVLVPTGTVGAGWYFATRVIDAGAQREYPVEVRAFDGSTVV